MKIGIIGNYGATNVGDEAILSSLLSDLPEAEITVFSAQPLTRVDRFREVDQVALFPLGIRSFFRYGFRKSIAALRKIEAVILGGGGLFQDDYLYACFLWAWQIFWVKRYKKPLFIYATGVGPLNTWLGRRLTRWAYSKADVITVRDQDSLRVLRSIGIKASIEVASDPVFAFKIDKNPKERTKNLFIISLRPWLDFKPLILESMTEFLSDLREGRECQLAFVCMQELKQSDLHLIKILMKRVGGELYVLKNFAELIDLMQRAEIAIGMRYHFMIAAILTGTPLVPISYAPKTEHLFDQSDIAPYLIRVHELNPYRLKNAFRQIEKDYQAVVEEMLNLKEVYVDQVHKIQEHLHTFLSDQKNAN